MTDALFVASSYYLFTQVEQRITASFIRSEHKQNKLTANLEEFANRINMNEFNRPKVALKIR